MPTILCARGAHFDVDPLLHQLDFTPHHVWRRGEVDFRGRPLQHSGLFVEVSEADFADAEQQITDALTFVQGHESALLSLAMFPGVDDRVLDFGIEDRAVGVHVDSFPHELLAALGRFRIDLAVSRSPHIPPEENGLTP